MKRMLFLFAILALSKAASAQAPKPPAKAPEPIPSSWREFLLSDDPANKRVTAEIQKMQWFDACNAWGREARAMKNERRRMALMFYLRDDKLINGVDLGNVPGPLPQTGMTACGVIAMLGHPSKVNNTERGNRLSAQWVYRERGIYVYTEGTPSNHNGTVTSVQY